MPDTLARLLADPVVPGEAWQPPEVPPAHGELMDALAILQVSPTDDRHAGFCLAKLGLAFEVGVKITETEAKGRRITWLEANGDLGDALWTEATLAALQTSKWMPKPSEFRALVAHKLDLRETQIRRVRQMLEAQGEGAEGGVPSGNWRVAARKALDARRLEGARQARDYYARLGHEGQVANLDEQIARMEGRHQPSSIERTAATPGPVPSAPKLRKFPNDYEAARLRNQAQTFRRQGHNGMAEQLEREAAELAEP